MEIKKGIKKYAGEIILNRREFHRIPELGHSEFKTGAKIREKLEAMGLRPETIAGTGLLAEIAGTGTGRLLALRADIDALPVGEETGAPYRSEHALCMHACGHDAHIAILLGAARMLLELKREFSGRVRLLFQPSEENSTGAKAMIADGAMDGVDGVFGLHVWSELDAGKISVEAGPRMASADFWRMEVRGRGGHGAMPHNTVDALIAGAAIVNSLQSVASREISPLEPVVLSIGEFRAGTLPNIIAETAYLSGTTRTFNADIREKLPGILRRIAENTAAAYRAGISLDYDFGSPVVENDPACSALAGAAVRKVLGEGALALLEKTLSGEDFAEYQRLAPGVFCFVGIRNPEIGAIHPQHSPRYAIDESVLAGAAAFTSQYALDFLGRG